MCVMSAVMDQWNSFVPQPTTNWPNVYTTNPQPYVAVGVENDKVRKIIDSLRKAMEAAQEIDALTNQPDCVDPVKEQLLERVEELERRLAELEKSSSPEVG